MALQARVKRLMRRVLRVLVFLLRNPLVGHVCRSHNQAMARIPNLQKLARQSGRYDAEAFSFISQGLCHAARCLGKRSKSGSDRHLCARELVDGTLDLAAERFGLLAELVLRNWGLRGPEDIGEITWTLIEHGVFSKQPHDRLEDFIDVPPFGPALAQRVQRRVMAEEPAT